MSDWKKRTRMLLGERAIQRLAESHVAVFGLGGVGSYVAEMLVRSGVGAVTLVDFDTVSETNRNRQLEALTTTIAMKKTVVMAERLKAINPELIVREIPERYLPENREQFFLKGEPYDFVADAIDLITSKIDLIETCLKRGIPCISAMGTGNKLDMTALRVEDISKTRQCALARVMRRELRRRGIVHHDVVYSPETPVPCLEEETPPPGRRSVPGSVPWVPAAAGLLLASEIVRRLTDDGCR